MSFLRHASWALLALFLCPAPGLAEEPPDAVVARVNAALIAAMQNAEALGYAGRRAALSPVLLESFNFPFMARGAAGRHWRKMSAAERTALAEAFTELSLATYAARFDGYGGERFEVGTTGERPRGTRLVHNRLIKADGEPVAINYLLRKFDGRWRIIDVFLAQGISEIATKRAEYTSVLEREGIDGLIAALKAKTAELAGGA